MKIHLSYKMATSGIDGPDKRRIKTHKEFLENLQHKNLPSAYHNHLIHTNASERDWSREEYIQIVIIDPGKVNLGFRIERRHLDSKRVETIAMERHVLRETFSEIEEVCKPADFLYGALLDFFQQYIGEFMRSHIIIMEKQVPNNTGMTRLGPAIIMYFAALLRDAPLLPLLIELFPTVKTSVLADKTLKKILGAKKWSIRIAIALFKARGDEEGLRILQSDPDKMDDMADTVVMPEAFLLLLLFDFHIPFLRTLYKVADVRRMMRERLHLMRLLSAVE